MAEKRCTFCKEVKPLSEYQIHTSGNPRGQCKACVSARRAAHYQANRESLRAKGKAYFELNREEANARSRAYRLANLERCVEHVRKWREANPERQRELTRRWHTEHAEELRAARQTPEGRAYHAEKSREFYRRHRERMVKEALPRKQLRRARLIGVGGVVTQAEWRETLAYFNGHCAYCGEPMNPPTQDHMMPISRGGAHLIENIVPACGTCNSRKHTRNLLEYLIYERG
jgi:5-methylcytosine-specific restriction endonuclease McrA